MAPARIALPTLTADDVPANLAALRVRQPVQYAAFYSSQLGGIVTDPALMVIPFDDHMVHRGHGIFDTAAIVDGRIYDLDAHLDRFLGSAERSKLKLPASRAEMRDIIIRTTAASGLRDGSIRYWLSSGPGSLDLTPVANADPGFFVMIFPGLVYPERWKTDGVRVMTTTYPIKPPLYAITKTTNYLPNVLMQMEAKEKGFDNGVILVVAVKDRRLRLEVGYGLEGVLPDARAGRIRDEMIFPGLVYPERWKTDGVKVMTTTYPIKPPLYAITKTTNYLPNVLMQMEAKEKGFDNGVFIDANGHVGESSNMNVAFVTKDGVLVHPKFDAILSGCTSLRLLELARTLVAQGKLTDVVVRDVSKADALAAREMLLIGSSVKVAGIVQWDGDTIGDGKPGPMASALLQLLEEDMRTGDRLIDVPY